MEELEYKFNIQQEIYLVLMEEKRLEEQRLFDLMVAEFTRLRSVKIIQRWWRGLVRRSRRSTLKKKKQRP